METEMSDKTRALVDAKETPRPVVISDLLRRPDTVKRFQQIVPRHLSAERMLRVMAHAIYKTPRLGECAPVTLLGAMQACAALGLEPNTPLQHAFLLPFRKSRKEGNEWVESYDVQLIIGYRGLIDLARRSGTLVSIHADVVYHGDDFEFEYGSNQHLTHRPRGDRTTPECAYAHAVLKDGEAFEVLPYAKVLAIRDESQGYKAALAAKAEAERGKHWRMREYDSSPWVKYEHEMAAKTMVRRLAKWLPLSLEFANAVALDSASETGKVDFAAFADTTDPTAYDPELAMITAPDDPEQKTSAISSPHEVAGSRPSVAGPSGAPEAHGGGTSAVSPPAEPAADQSAAAVAPSAAVGAERGVSGRPARQPAGEGKPLFGADG
jgi:recombination protein RecT